MIETEDSVDATVGNGLHITCSKDDLVQALGVVSRAVSTRTSVQILSGILLEAQGSELRLAATDMELSLRATLTAQIEGDGSIVLPGKTLADIARLLPADEVTIEHKPAESVVHVTSGTASYTLHTYNPEDFPRLPELDAVTVPTLVVQGARDPFGMPTGAKLRTVVEVAGDHSLRTDLPAISGAVAAWLHDLLAHT